MARKTLQLVFIDKDTIRGLYDYFVTEKNGEIGMKPIKFMKMD